MMYSVDTDPLMAHAWLYREKIQQLHITVKRS